MYGLVRPQRPGKEQARHAGEGFHVVIEQIVHRLVAAELQAAVPGAFDCRLGRCDHEKHIDLVAKSGQQIAAFFGIGFGGEMSAFPIIKRQYYGSAPVGTTYGWQMMGAGIGMAAGALMGGLLRDLTGSFTATMVLSLVLSGVGVASIFLLPSTHRHQIPDWEDGLPEEMRSTPQPIHSHGD